MIVSHLKLLRSMILNDKIHQYNRKNQNLNSCIVRQFIQNLYFSINTTDQIFLSSIHLHFFSDYLSLEIFLFSWSFSLSYYRINPTNTCLIVIVLMCSIFLQNFWQIVFILFFLRLKYFFYFLFWLRSIFWIWQTLVHFFHILITFVSDI